MRLHNVEYTVLLLSKDDSLDAAIEEQSAYTQDVQIVRVDNDELLAYISEKPGASLLVLDWDYPGLDLSFVMKFIPPNSEKEVLLLCSDVDNIGHIKQGRDDFVLKPYLTREVIARIDNSIARFRQMAEQNIEVGELFINLQERKVFERDREIALTVREFDLLVLLARNPGRVYAKEQIYNHVWGNYVNYYDRNLMSFISKLRKRLEPDDRTPKYILTHWGVGYYFNNKL